MSESQVYYYNTVLTVISNNGEFLELNTFNNGVSFEGVVLILKLTNLTNLYKRYKEESFQIINQIYHIFHTMGVIYQAEISNKQSALIWKVEKSKIDQEIKSYFMKIGIISIT